MMPRDWPPSARWPTSGPSSTNSWRIQPRKTTATTSDSSYAKPLRHCRQMAGKIRFLMAANSDLKGVLLSATNQTRTARLLQTLKFHLSDRIGNPLCRVRLGGLEEYLCRGLREDDFGVLAITLFEAGFGPGIRVQPGCRICGSP